MKHPATSLKLAIFPLFLLFTACAVTNSNVLTSPQAQAGQTVLESRNSAGLSSRGKVAAVSAVIESSTPEKMAYLVIELDISNESDQAIEIAPAGFTASDNQQQAFEILSAGEHVDVLNEMYKRDSTGNGVGAGTGTSFIDSSAYTGNSSFSNSGDASMATASGRNPSREARYKKDIESYLQATVLPAQQRTRGNIWVALPRAPAELNGLVLTIPVAGEKHEFRFSLSRS